MSEYNTLHPKEAKKLEFKQLKKKLLKKFPRAQTSRLQDGRYYVSQDGSNLIGSKYPDLCFTDDVFKAWKNLETIEHWNRIEERNSYGFQQDINQIKINSIEDDSDLISRYTVNNNQIEE